MGGESGGDMPVQSMSDAGLIAATGRSRADWFNLLDEAGARSWDHAAITRWLGGKHDDAWWAQGIALSYEQSRNLNEQGVAGEHVFDVTAAKTLPASPGEVWPYLVDDDERRRWLDLELRLLSETGRSLRFDGGERSRVVFDIAPAAATRSGRPRSTISIQHTRITRESVAETKRFWQDSLARLATIFAG